MLVTFDFIIAQLQFLENQNYVEFRQARANLNVSIIIYNIIYCIL